MSALPVWIAGRHPGRTLVRALILGGLCFVVFRYVALPVWTRGRSMEPTVHDRSIHLANLLAFRSNPPQRGDIVVVRGHGTAFMYLKRVLAEPGETIAFQRGALLINGQPVPEPYVQLSGAWNMSAIHLGADEYFVAGDNRSAPLAMHAAGVTRRHNLAGKLWW